MPFSDWLPYYTIYVEKKMAATSLRFRGIGEEDLDKVLTK